MTSWVRNHFFFFELEYIVIRQEQWWVWCMVRGTQGDFWKTWTHKKPPAALKFRFCNPTLKFYNLKLPRIFKYPLVTPVSRTLHYDSLVHCHFHLFNARKHIANTFCRKEKLLGSASNLVAYCFRDIKIFGPSFPLIRTLINVSPLCVRYEWIWASQVDSRF